MQPYVLAPSLGSDVQDEWIRLGMDVQMQAQQEPDQGRRNVKFAEAERHYRNALRVDPRNAIATQNLAVLYAQVGQVNPALLAIERAAMADGICPTIHVNRAFMCLETGRIDEAVAAAKHALSISDKTDTDMHKAEYISARFAMAMVSGVAGMSDDAVRFYNEILDLEPNHPVAAVNACFARTLVFSTPADLLAQRKRWYESAKVDASKKRPHDNTRIPDRKLRVGYVGGDFKVHSAAMIFGNVVLNHSDQIEVYLYSTLPVNDADHMTKLFKEKAGERWRDITAMNDDDAAALIHRDRIDILVDVAAHTAGGRLAIFCRKPAPVQVTAWGFAHGTGCPDIDYFFADPVAVPEEERKDFAEKIYDLPTVVTYREPKEYTTKATSRLPYFDNDFITFGCYARYEKMSEACLLTFAEILRRVPDSRLQLKDSAFERPYSIRRVMRILNSPCYQCPDCTGENCERCGDTGRVCGERIADERVLFSIGTSNQDHMLAYQQADLMLDPFPHGGGTVSLEQLYMGIPLLTMHGLQPSGRSASSVLTAMGRTDWIAKTPEEYVEKAVAMASDPAALNKARKTLRQEFLSSPVVSGYCGRVEEAYRDMWRKWCER